MADNFYAAILPLALGGLLLTFFYGETDARNAERLAPDENAELKIDGPKWLIGNH